MDILIKLLATKVVAGLIGVAALLGGKKGDVMLTKPDIKIISDTIFINTALKNSFSEGLEKIILSGTPVSMRLIILADNFMGEVVHNIKYDLIKKTFTVTRSQDSVVVKDIGTAKRLANEFNNLKILYRGREVSIIIKARLAPVKIEAIGDKEFELMYFWDYHSPTLKFVVRR